MYNATLYDIGQTIRHVSITPGIHVIYVTSLGFKQVDFFGNTPLELAIQLRCESSIIQLLAGVEEVSE